MYRNTNKDKFEYQFTIVVSNRVENKNLKTSTHAIVMYVITDYLKKKR